MEAIKRIHNRLSWEVYRTAKLLHWQQWNRLGGGASARRVLEPYKKFYRPCFVPYDLNDSIFKIKSFGLTEEFELHSGFTAGDRVEYAYHLQKPCLIEPEYGYTIMDDAILIPESLAWSHWSNNPARMKFFSGIPSLTNYRKAVKDRKSLRHEDIVISLRHIFQDNYGHCLIQVMPTLCLLDDIGVPTEIPILVPERLFKMGFFQGLIKRGSLSQRKWIVQGDGYISASEVIFARTDWPSPNVLNRFLDMIDVPFTPGKAARRFFLQRKNRNISNLDALLPELNNHGFEFVLPENLSFSEQVELFSQARIVCGVGGAALTNAIFSRSNKASILEICPQDWGDAFFYRMAKTCVVKHKYLFGNNFIGNRYSDFSVDPAAFKTFIELALNEH